MRIYTSCFSNAKTLELCGVKMISVALWQPRFLKKMPKLAEVAPSAWMVREAPEELYVPAYKRLLEGIGPDALMEKIRQIAQGSDVALCCYEKPGEFCHRHLLAQWLNSKTGAGIEEFACEKVGKPEALRPQPTLFNPG